MIGLSKLGIGMTLLFALSLLALLAELCYILCCRKIFRRKTSTGESDITTDSFTTPSKRLNFLCWKNKSSSLIEPSPSDPHDRSAQVSGDDLEKLYGQSRVLFTIREEEREELESDKSSSERKTKKRVSLDEEVVVVVMDNVERETQFFTPCGSPPYYTPSSSPPPHELENGRMVGI